MLLLGSAAVWLYRRQQSSAQRLDGSAPTGFDADGLGGDLSEANVLPSDLAPDEADPVQTLDDSVELAELDYDAMSREDAEAARDLAAISADLDARGGLDEVVAPTVMSTAIDDRVADVGELYGVHTPAALDRDIPDGDASFDQGENWIESLSASATEYGPEPEADLDVDDEDNDGDLPTNPMDHRDIPVADRGAAGPRGL